jgi:hypothetical protein
MRGRIQNVLSSIGRDAGDSPVAKAGDTPPVLAVVLGHKESGAFLMPQIECLGHIGGHPDSQESRLPAGVEAVNAGTGAVFAHMLHLFMVSLAQLPHTRRARFDRTLA